MVATVEDVRRRARLALILRARSNPRPGRQVISGEGAKFYRPLTIGMDIPPGWRRLTEKQLAAVEALPERQQEDYDGVRKVGGSHAEAMTIATGKSPVRKSTGTKATKAPARKRTGSLSEGIQQAQETETRRELADRETARQETARQIEQRRTPAKKAPAKKSGGTIRDALREQGERDARRESADREARDRGLRESLGQSHTREELEARQRPAKAAKAPAKKAAPAKGPARIQVTEEIYHSDESQWSPIQRYVLAWQGVNFRAVNGALRGSRASTPEIQQLIDGMDREMAGSRTDKAATVYRGFGDARVLFGDAWDGDLTGVTVTESAFMSTSPDESVAHVWQHNSDRFSPDRVIMELRVPPGTPAVWIEGGAARELLLARGQQMRVVEDRGQDQRGTRRLLVEVVPTSGAAAPAKRAPAAKKATPARTPARSVEDHATALDAMESREQAREYLRGVRGQELEALGRHFSVIHGSADSRREAIVEATVGSRRDFAAISGGATLPAAPAPRQQITLRPATGAVAPPRPADRITVPAPETTRQPRRQGPFDAADVAERLRNARSREEAREILGSATEPQLRALAEHTGVTLFTPFDRTIQQKRESAIDQLAGGRLDFGGIGSIAEGMFSGRPQGDRGSSSTTDLSDYGRALDEGLPPRDASAYAAWVRDHPGGSIAQWRASRRGRGAPRKATPAKAVPASATPNTAPPVDESVDLVHDPEGDNMRMHGDSLTMGLAQAYAAVGRRGSANRMMDLRRRATTSGPDGVTPQQVVEELREIRTQETNPEFQRRLDRAIEGIDAPMTPMPDLPPTTPPLARKLIEDLHAIPYARKGNGDRMGGGVIRGPSLVEQLAEVYRDAAAGRRGDDGRRPEDRIRHILRGQTHEVNEAAFRIWALERLLDSEGGRPSSLAAELRQWERDARS